MHSLRLSNRTMSYDAGLNMMLLHHQKPPNQDHDDEANEAGTIIIDPHNGATIKGKSHRKIGTAGKIELLLISCYFKRKNASTALLYLDTLGSFGSHIDRCKICQNLCVVQYIIILVH